MLKIKQPQTPSEYKAIEDIQRDAWGAEDLTITPHHVLIATSISNNCVYIATINDKPIGFVFGFAGFDEDSQLILHSHQLGVKKRYQNRNIGFLLKLKQREFALRRKIEIIKWTFDPLQSKNAYFNFNKLGVIATEYIRNLYGALLDELNKNLPTDRLYVSWYINSPRVRARLYKNLRPKVANLSQYPVATHTKTQNSIVRLVDYSTNLSEKIILIEIPWDINYIRNYDLQVALEWRLGLRELFERYIQKGYIIADFIIEKRERRVAYVLIRDDINHFISLEKWWR